MGSESGSDSSLALQVLRHLTVPIPLSKGQSVNVGSMNKFINQAVVREKGLKVIQYLARLVAFELKKRLCAQKAEEAKTTDEKSKSDMQRWHDHFLTLSKTLSTARRCF